MTMPKPVELDYLPVRNGGEDQLHTHLSFRPSAEQRESCGACAQLENDFSWMRLNDALAGREREFGTVEDAMRYAVSNVERKVDPRTFRDQAAAVA